MHLLFWTDLTNRRNSMRHRVYIVRAMCHRVYMVRASYTYENVCVTKIKYIVYINVRENLRGNQEWTIQRHWQHWVHKTQNEDKTKTQTIKLKR